MKRTDEGNTSRDEGVIHDTEDNAALDLTKLAAMKEELGPSFFRVVQHFHSGLLVRTEKIRQAILANDLESVAFESHSMKSVCRQIGLFRMGELADRLESIAHLGELSEIDSLVGQLIQAGQSAHLALTNYCSSE
ncbi:MAG: Hpt domain-containing protein [Magnetococcales bacterium]|nr:Hpt domain-containing protein [Magnetococcales bacterium]